MKQNGMFVWLGQSYFNCSHTLLNALRLVGFMGVAGNERIRNNERELITLDWYAIKLISISNCPLLSTLLIDRSSGLALDSLQGNCIKNEPSLLFMCVTHNSTMRGDHKEGCG